MRRARLWGGLVVAGLLSACDEKSCGGGGGAAASKGGGSFNASSLSAPAPAKLGRPDCKSGMCPIKPPAALEKSGADRFVGPAGAEESPLASLEQGAARLARKFDGAADAPSAPAPAMSSRPGWVCDGNSCRRVP